MPKERHKHTLTRAFMVQLVKNPSLHEFFKYKEFKYIYEE